MLHLSFLSPAQGCARMPVSVVVATTADVGVPDWRGVRRFGVGVGLVETVLQDRLDRAVGGRANVIAAPARRLDAPSAMGPNEADDAQARSEALLGMGLGLHDRLDQRHRRRADFGGLAHHSL